MKSMYQIDLDNARQKLTHARRMVKERPGDPVDWAGWVRHWEKRIAQIKEASQCNIIPPR